MATALRYLGATTAEAVAYVLETVGSDVFTRVFDLDGNGTKDVLDPGQDLPDPVSMPIDLKSTVAKNVRALLGLGPDDRGAHPAPLAG